MAVPSTMRAWKYTNPTPTLEASIRLDPTAPLPPSFTSLKPDEALIKVFTAALNPVDYKLPEAPVVSKLIIKRPATPGQDFAGRVQAVGKNSSLQIGQLVFGRTNTLQYGSLADFVLVGKEEAVPLPEGLKVDDGACVGTAGLTAMQSIAPFVKENDRVFVNGGSGGVGIFCIQIAKALGCYVVASCSTPNVELCIGLGADEVIDYKTTDILSACLQRGNFDLVVDNVGSDSTLYSRCHEFTKPSARYVQVGASSKVSGIASIASNMFRPGILGGGKRKFVFTQVKTAAKDFEQIGKWMAERKVKAVVDSEFSLEEAPKAIERVKTGRARGKVLVSVNNE